MKVSQTEVAANLTGIGRIGANITDLGILMKFKLSLTVVFSALLSFLIAIEGAVSLWQVLVLSFGGLFTAGAANALNQVLEKDYDRLMNRTANRPIATGRFSVNDGVLVAGLMSLIGVSLLALFNPLTAFLGMVSLIIYSFVYTPLKRISNLSVWVGAIPGALPVVIGCAAAQNGQMTDLALALFALQFFWQLPHFWAIAWLGDEDYRRAGFHMLPTADGLKDNRTGLRAFIDAAILLPVVFLPFFLGEVGWVSTILCAVMTLIYTFLGWKMYRENSREAARKLMFFSFAYLPVVLLVLFFDKI
jgi:heme o synthase